MSVCVCSCVCVCGVSECQTATLGCVPLCTSFLVCVYVRVYVSVYRRMCGLYAGQTGNAWLARSTIEPFHTG